MVFNQIVINGRRFVFLTCFWGLCSYSHAVGPVQDLSKAEALVTKGEWSLARRYLEPAIYSPHITNQLRSRFYYVRAYSFFEERLYVSAKKDFHRALEFDSSNRDAVYSLGRIYYYGKGADQDFELGVSFFRQAAEFDHRDAKFYIGYATVHGRGIEKNEAEGLAILAALSKEEHVLSMLHLANYYRGKTESGDQVSSSSVVDLYLRALSMGSADAALALGFMYKNGELVAMNAQLSYDYFVRAVALGNRQALLHLAYAHMTGSGAEQSYRLAKGYYLEAAEHNLEGGFLGLGHLYEFGLGLPVNKAVAESFYQLASNDQDSKVKVAREPINTNHL